MNRLAHSAARKGALAANQPELPLRVTVCAWCKPRDVGTAVAALSHGICPRHFREMKLAMQTGRRDGEGVSVRPKAGRSRRLSKSLQEIAQLRLPFPAPLGGVVPFSA